MSPILVFNFIRMNGRFMNSLIPDETKSPVYFHGDVSHILSQLKKQYRILM